MPEMKSLAVAEEVHEMFETIKRQYEAKIDKTISQSDLVAIMVENLAKVIKKK